MMCFKKTYLLIFSIVLINTHGNSQDLKGGEINLQHIVGLSYNATIRIYYNIPTYTPRPFILLDWGDSSPLDSLIGVIDGCGNNNTLTNKYIGTHTYSNTGNYIISCSDSFRVANIQNISNSSNEKLYLQHLLPINPIWGTNNPTASLNCLVDTFKCCSWVYNSGTVDLDGDSLSYSLVPPATTNYTMPPANINPFTGDLTFNPIVTGLYALSMRIDEWRTVNNTLYNVGTTFREMLVVVDSAFLTSVNEHNFQHQVSIYPNPNNGVFNVDVNITKNSVIQVYNISGQLILQKTLTKNITQVNLTEYSKGMYFVKVETDNKTIVRKIVYQ